MKTISVQISDADYDMLKLSKEEMFYSEFKDILEQQLAREALANCVKLAKETGVSDMTLEDVDAEVSAGRYELSSHLPVG
jgi:hypothetical protein